MREPATLRRLARTARWTALRLRFSETLARAVLLLPIPLAAAIAALAYVKVTQPPSGTVERLAWGLVVPALVVVVGAAHAWLRPRARHLGALALDRHHGLDSRISNALAFSEVPASERTSLMQIAIEDAVLTVERVSPRRAAPIAWPRELPLVLVLLAGLTAIAAVEVRTLREVPPAPVVDPMVMSLDDIDLFRETAKELEQQAQDPEAMAAARRFNQLMEDIADRRLDRREVFRRLEQLERELAKGAQAESEALEEGLQNVARELERSDLTKAVSEPLKEKKLADAEQALRELAEKLRNKQRPPSKAELDRLREALERASKSNAERAKSLEEERQRVASERKRLLEKQNKDKLSKKDEKELERTQRQLERLEREKKQNARAQQKLSKLDRELAQAAADLAKELGKGAESLESAAEDINRMAREQLSEKEKQRLLERMRELREVLRQQGKGGKERMQRMQRFSEKARGQRGEGSSGRPGGGQGKGSKPGDGSEIRLGRGGAPIPGPGGNEDGAGQGSGQGHGQRGGTEPGEGAGRGGKEWGTGHDPNLEGEASALKGSTHDVTAAGVDTNQGTASSEVIMGAAERGFLGKGYRKVYTDYRAVAEEVMNQDDIPPGYRFYVQRYFQLIRPRE